MLDKAHVYIHYISLMIDVSHTPGFWWKKRNDRTSADTHSVGQCKAEQLLFDKPLLLTGNVRRSGGEMPLKGLVRPDDNRLAQLPLTLRRQAWLLRVIARPGHAPQGNHGI